MVRKGILHSDSSYYNLTLILNHIQVWNVKSGEVKARMQDTSCSGPIYAFTWMDGRIENTGHLILALHPPFNLTLVGNR